MTPDQQEALSHQHSHGWWCVPLDSGRIAVFTHPNGKLVDVVESWAGVVALSPRLRLVNPVTEIEVEIDL